MTDKIIYLRTYVEAAIDFTDEEIDFLSNDKLAALTREIKADLARLLNEARQGSLLREGVTAVIAGKPNVGKSSLLNRFSGNDIAIVTDIPGTTRDVLRDLIMLDGLPVHIVDTAGLRETTDIVEQEGMRRAHQAMESADLVLYLEDAMDTAAKIDLPAASGCPVIRIRNKIDLTADAPSVIQHDEGVTVSISAKTGSGIDLLKQEIKKMVGLHDAAEGVYLARRRHLDALKRAQEHVEQACIQLKSARTAELAAEDLRLAQLATSEITGVYTSDDLLSSIFSSFCIGK